MYKVYGEKTNGQKNPECLYQNPIFSWRLESDGYHVRQKSFEIVIYKSDGSKIFQSGQIKSTKTHGISFDNVLSMLDSMEDYYWTVKSYSNINGKDESCISKHVPFQTGILNPKLWAGKWLEPDLTRKPIQDEWDSDRMFAGKISYLQHPEEKLNPSVYFRQEIRIRKKIKRGKLLLTSHGIYTAYVNGTEYGDLLAPGYTVYRDYLEYQVYDVTDSLSIGINVLGAIVSDGWYLGKIGLMGIGNQYGENPALLFQLHVWYEDGLTEIFGSNETCKANTGAYRYADLYVGEGYDSSRELVNWQKKDYMTEGWATVHSVNYGIANLKGTSDEKITFLRIEPPKKVFRSPKGELIVDAGENVAGFLAITGKGSVGNTITLEYSEVLDEEGNFLRNIIGQNKNQTDSYTTAGNGIFTYRPKFTYHGFQYVRISGIKEEAIMNLQVCVIGTDLEQTGTFHCSNEKINQLHSNIFRSQQGNMVSIPTDCPQREKAGWTGDMQIFTPTACFLMDMEAFLQKWLANMRMDQKADGQIPHVIPDIPSNRAVSHGYSEVCSSGWADACVIIPYHLYQVYGNIHILKENYNMMQRWMSYVEQKAASEVPGDVKMYSKESLQYQKYLWNTGFHYGDWLIPSLSRAGVERKPIEGAELTKEMTAPTMFAYTTDLMTKIALILNKPEDAAHYRFLNSKIKEAYIHEYFQKDGHLKLPYQGVYVLALAMDLVPEDVKCKTVNILVKKIHENKGCLDTGFLSMPFLLDVLYENGKQEEAYKLLFQERCPSWLYEVNKGANTIWESWTNIDEQGHRNKSSYNHFAFGCVGDFIYRRILGIQCLAPGYSQIKICPDLFCGLGWARGEFESVNGKISVFWRNDTEAHCLEVQVPPNVEAEIIWDDKTRRVGSGFWRL